MRDPVFRSMEQREAKAALRALYFAFEVRLMQLAAGNITDHTAPKSALRHDAGPIIAHYLGLIDGAPKEVAEIAVAYALTIVEVEALVHWGLNWMRTTFDRNGLRGSWDETRKVIPEPAEFAVMYNSWEGPRCERCDAPIPYAGTGRPRSTCSNKCRQSLYRCRKTGTDPKSLPTVRTPTGPRPTRRWEPRSQNDVFGYPEISKHFDNFSGALALLAECLRQGWRSSHESLPVPRRRLGIWIPAGSHSSASSAVR